MKKRILSILLTLCMTLCLTPISVFAEEVGAGGSAAIQLGTDALSVLSKNVNTATAPTVYFGQNHENNPAAWRVIGYDGSGVTSSKGDIACDRRYGGYTICRCHIKQRIRTEQFESHNRCACGKADDRRKCCRKETDADKRKLRRREYRLCSGRAGG